MKKLMTMTMFLFCSLSILASNVIFNFNKSADGLTKEEITQSLALLASDANSRLAKGLSLFDVGYADSALNQGVEAINNEQGLLINTSGCCGGYVQTKAIPIYYGYKGYSQIVGWLYYGINTEYNPETDSSSTALAFAYSKELDVEMFEDGYLEY